MWVKFTKTLSLDVFCRTEVISMLRNELIKKKMVAYSQTSKSKEQKEQKRKNKDYRTHSIYFFATLAND